MPSAAEERAFLKPILSAFADDGPRLIYADYLDASSQPGDIARAEFIRLQVALARLGEDHPQRRPLLRRQNELLLRWTPEWTKHLKGMFAGCEFRRGILDTLSVDSRFFCDDGARLFVNSAVRRVKFLDACRQIDRLVKCPALANVRELDLCGNDLGNGGVNMLMRSPFLAQLESLDLSFNGIGDGGVQRLAGATGFPRLKALHLNDNHTIGCEGMRALTESPNLACLKTLDVSGNDIGSSGFRSLASSPILAPLNHLRIHANRVGDGGVAALAQSGLLDRMLKRDGRLDLRENNIGPAGAVALAAAPALALARTVDLGGNRLGDDGVMALVEAGHLGRLRKLSLRHNRIGDAGARGLAYSELMAQLDHLDVSSNRLTPRVVELLWTKRKDFRTALDILGQFCSSPAFSV